MSNTSIIATIPLGFQWPVLDPFLFCVHHQDFYPRGNGEMGPDASLDGRRLGEDFTPKDGWRMYHGETIPGFPAHPHRGFETVTIVLNGYVDHSDSHGQAGRYGNGDVQWMTAGSGLQHSEMFPLLHDDKENPLELFQVWLNLPASKKMAEPYFKMLWAEEIPVYRFKDGEGRKTTIRVIAGSVGEVKALDPAPDSWASDPENDVQMWIIKMEAGARWTIPGASADVFRVIYFYEGEELTIDETRVEGYRAVQLAPENGAELVAGDSGCSIFLLQGKPIGESVVQHGPFVMNSRQEIMQAFVDFEATQFGGWPWPRRDNVHGKEKDRFAFHLNGREEEPGQTK